MSRENIDGNYCGDEFPKDNIPCPECGQDNCVCTGIDDEYDYDDDYYPDDDEESEDENIP